MDDASDKTKSHNKLALLEACLFTTEKPLQVEQLEKILNVNKETTENLLNELEEKYKEGKTGIELSKIGGFRLIVKPEYIKKVSKLTRHADMSRGLLRVLSIIAYHEPVKQSDLVKVIGNRVYEYVKELKERNFIKTEKSSRTKTITTTKQFEEYFGGAGSEIKSMEKEPKK